MLNYYEQQATNKIEQSIDLSAFNESDLQEITFPLNMPYYSDSKMESISGEVELNGIHYQYVKRKIENNILHIWCLNNIEKNRISTLKLQLSKSNTDNNSSEKSKHNFTLKTFQTECLEICRINLLENISANNYITYCVINNNCFSVFNPSQTAKPPENVLA